MMKRLPKFLAIVLTALPATAMAQAEPQPQPAPAAAPEIAQILVNQPFASKSLGDLMLPFMWEAKEDEKLKRLVVTETRTDVPAVLTIDLLTTPKTLDNQSVAAEIANAMAESLATKTSVSSDTQTPDCGKSKCPSLTFYKAEMEGSENGIPRKCAIEILPLSGKTLVLTLCAEASRKYSTPFPEVLHQIFTMMK